MTLDDAKAEATLILASTRDVCRGLGSAQQILDQMALVEQAMNTDSVGVIMAATDGLRRVVYDSLIAPRPTTDL